MKLDKVKFLDFTEAQELSKGEQKMILGGYNGSNCCIFVDDNGRYHCTNSSNYAYEHGAGKYGTWACNTYEAHRKCAGSTNFC